jgi:hypothetical protein
MITPQMKVDSLRIAQDDAPKDKGVLAFESIKTWDIPNGFVIAYLKSIAPYIDFQEYGTSISTKNVGFIEKKTYWDIYAYLNIALQNKRPNLAGVYKRTSVTGQATASRSLQYLRNAR